ncbi:UNVERIFIED_CONTAM: Retrovirus-related Pol polyprotein from transposon RE2 [Sesamum latifolium]|uniref:Retrovirus-related Pol polyprotein from transposon RE2 n=1 Tax=Sesamum latifolium TaxID=2727402 RepID=A0AAW2U2L8_9LAMI
METNKFNGTNYTDWLRNLRIVLDFENQSYVLDKTLPTALPEGSSPEERLTFEKWHEDNRKICRDKRILRDQDGRGIVCAESWGQDAFPYGKLEDLKVGLSNDTYIDVILQSLPPSYDPFIVNYNMNGLEKSIHELINMLVQYEAMTHKSEPAVLVGEASTSKAKGKGARRWKRKKGKGTAVTATASTRGTSAAPKGKGKGKVRGSQRSKANDVCMHCQGKGHWKRECPQFLSNPGMFVVEVNMIFNSTSWVLDTGCGAHICNNLQVLERSRKLSKDEMVLRLSDGKAVAAGVVGSLSLVVRNRIRIDLKDCYFVPINDLYILQQSNLIMSAQHKRKMDNYENAQIWHARLSHIFKDRIRRLVDSKNLEIDNLDHLPTCESCLKGKMIKKPFVGQSAIANSLLDLVHTDVCEPLSIPARGGFSYFITFIDDHSRYGYVYLMRYKSEAFGRFKEYRLEVENQTNRKIKALRSDRGGEYLSGEFINYLKENRILSQWTPPGAPQLNGVAERRNRTLLDMTPYEICHGKPASYKYLRVWGSPAYVKRLVGDKLDSRSSLCSRRDEVLIEKSNEEPQHDSTTSFEPTVHTDGVPVLHRSTRESRVPERYGFVGLTSQLDNDPKMYGEAMPDIDSDKWLEAIKFEMDSTGSNQVWTLVDPPKGTRPVGCKWVYKRKLGANGEVTAFKARLMAKGYTQRPGVDFEETYSPVAMAKSIRILLAIATCHKDFIKNDYDPCIYKKIIGSSVAYLVLYVDDILLIENDVKMLGDIKAWLSTQFSIKDMGEASYILGIKIYMDRSRRMLGLKQSSYIEKVLKRFKMEHSKRGLLPMRHGIKLSKKQSPKIDEELKRMSNIPYASAIGSIQYVVQCTRPDVIYALSVTSRYQTCAGEAHWGAVKSILKYLKRTKYMFLIYGSGELILEGYSDTSFQSDDDDTKSNRVLYSSLMVVWSLGRVPSRIPQRIPPRKLNTSQLQKLPRRRFG